MLFVAQTCSMQSSARGQGAPGTNRGLPSLGDVCREFIAEDHRYYLNFVK